MKNCIILGIESSCDDTGVAVVSGDGTILSNIVISQNKQHAEFQGVVPEIAARSHLQNLEQACNDALKEANCRFEDLSAIAATSGPGLIGGVIVGCMFAKTLSSILRKPFIAINHLEGHALTARLSNKVEYPYLLLLVSGGHCQFIAVHSLGRYTILGKTLDDAVGEAFDKVAKMLGLPFPGGPEIEKYAVSGDSYKYQLPKPLLQQSNCNMSFSGLKTAVRTLINSISLNQEEVCNIAASFQRTVAEILSIKTLAAMEEYQKICDSKTFVIAGGVASNLLIRKSLSELAESRNYAFIAPPIQLCTDNAAMIAWAGIERFSAGLENSLNFCPRARWPLSETQD